MLKKKTLFQNNRGSLTLNVNLCIVIIKVKLTFNWGQVCKLDPTTENKIEFMKH